MCALRTSGVRWGTTPRIVGAKKAGVSRVCEPTFKVPSRGPDLETAEERRKENMGSEEAIAGCTDEMKVEGCSFAARCAKRGFSFKGKLGLGYIRPLCEARLSTQVHVASLYQSTSNTYRQLFSSG